MHSTKQHDRNIAVFVGGDTNKGRVSCIRVFDVNKKQWLSNDDDIHLIRIPVALCFMCVCLTDHDHTLHVMG